MAGSRPDMRPHMRPGPPPGLRAAAEMERERAQQGGGRGMMGVVLPMYAVGIVLYLIYTLVKVFNKNSGEERQDDLTEYLNKDPASVYDTGPLDTEAKMEEFLKQQKTNELEKLLIKADDKNISSGEMRALQKRLEETEAQMTQILQAMQAVSHKVEDVASANPDVQDVLKSAGGTPSSPSNDEKASEDNQEGEKSGKSTDSSPDMDSFEIVGKKDSNATSDQSNNTEDDISQSLSSEVENIGQHDSQIKMTESDSTESCAGEKDNSVAPESERDETGADGSEELLPEEDTQHDTTVRHRNVETSNNS
ncbi:hypothetical protein LOTGIDRAFT_151923 [Lottia gigantea]|uniref:Resistance to inhibitors of cholinesterase protein 3 N-terminal domain-containing protein n=1 Tax=Lottia gigantea TaxID=225164 RepID=V4ALR2_LOTGI|nr:hypothetical protein LOTGIDRAFT_151923 [Lottia gigantea]ESP05124.1 hypothetical protein LOTGIDRAFT_151923 [Lottia gigantea]